MASLGGYVSERTGKYRSLQNVDEDADAVAQNDRVALHARGQRNHILSLQKDDHPEVCKVVASTLPESRRSYCPGENGAPLPKPNDAIEMTSSRAALAVRVGKRAHR